MAASETVPPTSSAATKPALPALVAALLDVAVVVVFVAVGRRNHGETTTMSAVAATAAPFLAGLAVGWIASRAWNAPASRSTGIAVWATTLIAGMASYIVDDGVAPAFVAVATVFLAAGLMGWRAVARRFSV